MSSTNSPKNRKSTAYTETSQLADQLLATLTQKPPHTALFRVHEVVDVLYEELTSWRYDDVSG